MPKLAAYRRRVTSRETILADLDSATEEDDEPIGMARADLGKISSDDLPVGVRIEIIDKEADGVIRLAFAGVLVRIDNTTLVARVEEHGWRKFWAGSLGVQEYHDLILASVQARSHGKGDVRLHDIVDEDVVYGITFDVTLPAGDLKRALDHAEHVRAEVVEAAEAVRVGIDDLVATASKRLKGWGSDPLDVLVDRMRDGAPHDKGRTLEELTSRLFNTVPGFTATGHILTETEEIDIRIQNTSDEAYWRRLPRPV